MFRYWSHTFLPVLKITYILNMCIEIQVVMSNIEVRITHIHGTKTLLLYNISIVPFMMYATVHGCTCSSSLTR